MMLKFLFVLLVLVGIMASPAKAQNLSLEGCEYTVETQNTPGQIPFYAVKNDNSSAASGRILFIAGGHGWTYTWNLDGVEHADGQYASDSSWFSIPLRGNGVYSVRAVKPGFSSLQSGDFRIFYAEVPEFGITLHDVENCEQIKITIDDFVPAFFEYGGVRYYGSKNVKYLLSTRQTPWSFNDYQSPAWEIPVEVSSKDETYFITITDRFGLEWKSDEAKYTSVIPEAKFNVDPKKGEAPLEVNFRNESVNAQAYEWYLYKDTLTMEQNLITVEDSLVTGRIYTEQSFTYTYEHPGSYNVKLVAINTRGANRCASTVYIDAYIQVDSSLVDVPNVFTPNGDGINDVFKVKAASLQSFHAVILNRWGRKVHEWNDPEGGWDGRINGKYASPGTYYYIITARGRETNAPRYIKKGALLLVR